LRRSARRGATLIEAAAGLALIGSLLVSTLLATAALERKQAAARRKLQACALAEEALASLGSRPGAVPAASSPPNAAGLWIRATQRSAAQDGLVMDVLRLDVLSMDPSDEQPLVSVEVLASLPAPPVIQGNAGIQ
jgi:hypothetical protein